MNQYYPKKSQLTGIRWLARHILLASILVLAGINVAHAVPVLNLPADITTDNDAGLCGANVNYDVTATDDSGDALYPPTLHQALSSLLAIQQ